MPDDDDKSLFGGDASPMFENAGVGLIGEAAPLFDGDGDGDGDGEDDPLADMIDPLEGIEYVGELGADCRIELVTLQDAVHVAHSEWVGRFVNVVFNTCLQKLEFLDAIGWKYFRWLPSHQQVHGNTLALLAGADDFPPGDVMSIGFDAQSEDLDSDGDGHPPLLFSDPGGGLGPGTVTTTSGESGEGEPNDSGLFAPDDSLFVLEDGSSISAAELFEDEVNDASPEEKVRHERMKYMMNQMSSTYWQDYFDASFWMSVWFDTEPQLNDFMKRFSLTLDEHETIEGMPFAEALGFEVSDGTFRDKMPTISKRMARLAFKE